tara:strand:+ start:125 stop:295 length:171 start_codon:yes stop_codon:yes gene_type:complete
MNIERELFEHKQKKSRALIGKFVRQETLRLKGGSDHKPLPLITFDQLFNTIEEQSK